MRSDENLRKLPIWLRYGLLPVLLFGGAAFWLIEWKTTSIEELLDPNTRLRAYYRLWLAEDHHEMYDPLKKWRNFRDYHSSIEILECPQGNEGPPLFLVMREVDDLHLMKKRTLPLQDPKQFLDWEQWKLWWQMRNPAGPITTRAPLASSIDRLPGYVIDLVDHEAKLVERPFNGASWAKGVFYDLNQDGWIERVRMGRYGGYKDPRDLTVETVNVVRVKPKQELVFSVVINVLDRGSPRQEWWNWACVDVEGDGIIEIVVGPEDPSGTVIPKVTFRWDETLDTYVDSNPPANPAEAEYLILPSDEKVWQEIEKEFEAVDLFDRINRRRPVLPGGKP